MTRKGLNHYAISHALGSTVVPGVRARFGAMRLLGTVSELAAHRPVRPASALITDSDDRVILKAFESVRNGLAADRLLSDPQLTQRFNAVCHQLGLRLPPADVNRRLLRLRKATGGGRLRPTTRREVHRDLLDRFGPAVEIAMVRMSVQSGASVDDLLADPALGDEFETIARSIIDGGSPVEYRVCALQIRKTRRLRAKEQPLFDQLRTSVASRNLQRLGTLAGFDPSKAPEKPGVIVLSETDRTLLVAGFSSLRSGSDMIARSSLKSALTCDSLALTDDASHVAVKYLNGRLVNLSNTRLWALRLISDLNPAFNWPVHPRTAA